MLPAPVPANPTRPPLFPLFRYLDTRREEFDAIGRQWQALKAVAERVDTRIKDPPSRDFLTCVHGGRAAARRAHCLGKRAGGP